MPTLITILAVIVIIALLGVMSSKSQGKACEEMKRKRKEFFESKRINPRIIVDEGLNMLFVDDATSTYGIDTSGTLYKLDNISSLCLGKGSVSIQQEFGNNPAFVDIGDDSPLSIVSRNYAVNELIKPIRKKLEVKLANAGVISSEEYVIQGHIWGYDIEHSKFFCAQGGISIYDFSDLISVKTDNGMEGGFKIAEKRIHIKVKDDICSDDSLEYEIYFDEIDDTYNGLLSMFKEIRNSAINSTSSKTISVQQNKSDDIMVNFQVMQSIVKETGDSQNSDFSGMFELFILALVKFVVDKTVFTRKNKIALYNECIASINVVSIIDGNAIYGDFQPEEAIKIVASFDSMSVGFPKIIIVNSTPQNIKDFIYATLTFVQALENNINNKHCDTGLNDVWILYKNELNEIMK